MREKKQQKDTDTKEKDKRESKSGRFETTTTLNLFDTFGDDEVTLKEDLPESESVEEEADDGDSVTHKLDENYEATEISLISRHLKQIEHSVYDKERELGAWGRIKNFFKLVYLVVMQFVNRVVEKIKEIPLNKRTLIIVLSTVAVIAVVIVLIVSIVNITSSFETANKTTIAGKKRSTLSASSILQLTSLELTDLKGEKVNFKKIKAGSVLLAQCNLVKWNPVKDEKLSLTADVRVYSGGGKLILYQPKFLRYVGKIDMKDEVVRIKARLDLSKKLRPGFYRILLSVTETSTRRRVDVQRRIKVVP